MSTILKALRRLEEERSLEQSHSLHEHVTRGSDEPPRKSSGLKLLLIVAVGLVSAAAGGWGFALWSSASTQAPPTVAAAPIARVAAPSPVAVAQPARLAAAVPAPANESPADARSPRPALTAAEPVRPVAAPTAEPVIVARVAAPAPEPATISVRPPEEPRSEATSVPSPPVRFAEDVAIILRGEQPLPTIEDNNPRAIEPPSALSLKVEKPLPVIRRAEVLGVEVVQTIWHPQPARRQAVLRIENHDELLRVAEGDAVGTLVLLEIQPAGVVFSHEGVQIQRRVGDRSHL